MLFLVSLILLLSFGSDWLEVDASNFFSRAISPSKKHNSMHALSPSNSHESMSVPVSLTSIDSTKNGNRMSSILSMTKKKSKTPLLPDDEMRPNMEIHRVLKNEAFVNCRKAHYTYDHLNSVRKTLNDYAREQLGDFKSIKKSQILNVLAEEFFYTPIFFVYHLPGTLNDEEKDEHKQSCLFQYKKKSEQIVVMDDCRVKKGIYECIETEREAFNAHFTPTSLSVDLQLARIHFISDISELKSKSSASTNRRVDSLVQISSNDLELMTFIYEM